MGQQVQVVAQGNEYIGCNVVIRVGWISISVAPRGDRLSTQIAVLWGTDGSVRHLLISRRNGLIFGGN
jgi:hypothetical protein